MFSLDSFLPFRLSVLSQSVSRLIENIYSDLYGLTMNQWRCLALIANQPGITAKELCEKAVLDKMTVSRALRALLNRRLISRTASIKDGRSQHLDLTPIGREIYDKVIPLARDCEARLLQALSEQERTNLSEIMEKLQKESRKLLSDKNNPA